MSVETAEGLLEGFFTDAEHFADGFRGAVVIEAESACLMFEGLDDLGGEGFDSLVTGGIEAEVEEAIGSDITDEALDGLTDLGRGGEVIVVEEALGGVFDDGGEAEGGASGDEERGGVTGVTEWFLFREVLVESGGGDDTVCFGVEADADHD